MGHQHRYIQIGQEGTPEDVHVACLSSAPLDAPASPQTKHQGEYQIITDFTLRRQSINSTVPSLHTCEVTPVDISLLFSGTALTQEWTVWGGKEMT